MQVPFWQPCRPSCSPFTGKHADRSFPPLPKPESVGINCNCSVPAGRTIRASAENVRQML
ncbi:hypothetical protein M514_24790 [Trichuris suis]|uniref:Uncharacterized protein n=1 Tax=Trichuris suis TaxID=68888 RepID=A0A085N0M7_9BILA|nr:hypothetical protein M514_24790 [Trichuris suis]